jgi:prophage regulatory protein
MTVSLQFQQRDQRERIAMIANEPRKMLVEDQILDIIPVSRSTLWRLERSGKFPRGTLISPNRKVWFEDEIIAWQNAVSEYRPRLRGKSAVAGATPVAKATQ